MSRVCIAAAKRTVIGRFMGGLSKQSAVDLAVAAGQATLGTVSPEDIDQVIVGNILSAGLGMNISRQVAMGLAVPQDRIAFTVNMMCASGVQSVMLASQAIRSGDASVVLCGGTESMTNAPFILDRARTGYKLGHGTLTDLILRDGLVDTFSNEHMGLTAELLAEKFDISRRAQDEFAARSQQNYHKAQSQAAFADELVEVAGVTADEHPRSDTTADTLAGLKPVFKPDGTVTAGNASGINDGAAMMVLCDEKTAEKRSWKPLAAIRACSSVGCDPKLMGLGPVHATRMLCERNNIAVHDFDAVELNEAFASQALACAGQLQIDDDRLNMHGGAIALGHPIAASGVRILVHLAHQIARGDIRKGLGTLCVGGGFGVAVALEPVPA